MHVRRLVVVVIAALAVGCADAVVVNTGESPPRTETSASPTPTRRSDPNLVDAHAYYLSAGDVKGYYFTTPSGNWNCAILPHSQAGCQATAGALRVAGAPDTVEDPDGDPVAPNAIAVSDEGDPGFAWLDNPGFSVPTGKAAVLDFNQTLAAAGFRCNVQEAGVSCQNEMSQKGFTFSASDYAPRYTPVPA